jgi:glutamine synthetase
VERFSHSEVIGKIFGTEFQRLYTACKQQEISEMRKRISDVEYDAYLKNA